MLSLDEYSVAPNRPIGLASFGIPSRFVVFFSSTHFMSFTPMALIFFSRIGICSWTICRMKLSVHKNSQLNAFPKKRQIGWRFGQMPVG